MLEKFKAKLAALKLKLQSLKNNQYLLPGVIVAVGLIIVITALFLSLTTQPKTPPQTKTAVSLRPTPTPYVQKTWTVMVTKMIFVPKVIRVKKGGTLNFLNINQEALDIESSDTPQNTLLNIGAVPLGSIKAVVMPNSGTYKYVNQLNPKQQGTVVVE